MGGGGGGGGVGNIFLQKYMKGNLIITKDMKVLFWNIINN